MYPNNRPPFKDTKVFVWTVIVVVLTIAIVELIWNLPE